MDSLDLDALKNIDVQKIDRRDILNEPLPIYNDNERIQNMVYSSSLAILKGFKAEMQDLLKNHIDKSIQHVVLSINSDTQTDIQQIVQASMTTFESSVAKIDVAGNKIEIPLDVNTPFNARPLLPSVAFSSGQPKFLYSSPFNNSMRYQFHAVNKSRQIVSYVMIPMEYKITMRYYCPTFDMFLRLTDSLALNSQLAMPHKGFNKGFTYKVITPDPNYTSYINGSIQIQSDPSEQKPTKVDFSEGGLKNIWCLEIPIRVFASIISRPYLVPAVISPQIKININGHTVQEFIVLDEPS
jgi:hypothetical protein